MNKKVLFIINPNAGKAIIKNKVVDIIDLFNKKNYEVTTYITQSTKDAYLKTKEMHTWYDLILCSGGDGTLNEVISACIDVNYTKSIAYIPTGTTNDFATTAQLSKQPVECAQQIIDGTPTYYDIGKCNDTYFSYIAAFGIFSDIAYTTPQSSKNLLGHSAYLLESVKQWFNIPRFDIKIEYDNEVIEGTFNYGMITNSLSIGGFHFFSEAQVNLNDGLFECLFIKAVNNPSDLQSIISALLTKDFENCSQIIMFRTKKLKVSSSEELAWTCDGEFGGNLKICEIENLQNAIQIIK